MRKHQPKENIVITWLYLVTILCVVAQEACSSAPWSQIQIQNQVKQQLQHPNFRIHILEPLKCYGWPHFHKLYIYIAHDPLLLSLSTHWYYPNSCRFRNHSKWAEPYRELEKVGAVVLSFLNKYPPAANPEGCCPLTGPVRAVNSKQMSWIPQSV